MKIQLPLENWADLLPFVPRRQLVALLFKLGDPQFASILQYCLNEEGHVTLGHLRIWESEESNANAIDGPIVGVTKLIGWTPVLETLLPDEPIPKNVENFKALTFRYFDSSVLNFLQKFHQHKNALLANVNLSIHHDLPLAKLQPVLAQILPLMGDNINSLQLFNNDLLDYSRLLNNIQSGGNNDEFSDLVTNMLAQTRILSINRIIYSRQFDWCCFWLYAPRMDGRPRMLDIKITEREALDFVNLIKKDFSLAKHPVTFFIRMKTCSSDLVLENIRLENGETNESLLMVKKYNGEYLISRFLKEADGVKWIQTYGQEILEFEHVDHDRTIYLDSDIKNGETTTTG